jgi:CheY-like chemotaxis protein
MISSLVTRTLETAGYTVLTASDGVEALTCLRNQPEPVHLVITDMLMPNMTGLELIKEMRKEFPDTTVMVITGYTSDLRLGADLTELQSLLLRKPFTPSLLLQRVRGTLDAVERNRLKAQ